MFEWVDNLFAWFAALGDDIDYMFDALNQLVYDLDNYIKFSTMYIYFSGVALFLIFLILIINATKLSGVKEQNAELVNLLKGLKEDVDGRNVKWFDGGGNVSDEVLYCRCKHGNEQQGVFGACDSDAYRGG